MPRCLGDCPPLQAVSYAMQPVQFQGMAPGQMGQTMFVAVPYGGPAGECAVLG